MGSQTKPKLPIIDFTKGNLNPGTSFRVSTANQVRNALENYGCFTVVYDKVSVDLHDDVFNQSKHLYDLPMEIKVQNTSKFLGFGYGSNFSFMPLIEYFGIENGATLEATQNFTNLMWPSGNQIFCETVMMYSKLLSELDHLVMKLAFESYGAEKYCDPLIESSFYLIRFMKYRGPKPEEINVGLKAHTDKNFLAIIDTNQVKGLEIETKDGEWIGFDPSPSTFLVIAGEPFMAWSNGRIYAPLHHVVMKGDEPKYSIGLFSFMREEIEIPEELVDEEHSLKYKTFNHLSFLDYCRKVGTIPKLPINAYCGI